MHVATCTCIALLSLLNLVQIETAARQFAIARSNFSLQKNSCEPRDNIDKASTILCIVYAARFDHLIIIVARKIMCNSLPQSSSTCYQSALRAFIDSSDIVTLGCTRDRFALARSRVFIIVNLIVGCAFFLSSLNDNRNDLIMCVFSVCEWY